METRMCFNYNVKTTAKFASAQGKDRIVAIADFWSTVLETCKVTDSRAEKFVRQVCLHHWSVLAEQACLDLLSIQAREKLVAIFRHLFPDTIFVVGAGHKEAKKLLWKRAMVLHIHCGSFIMDFETMHSQYAAILSKAPTLAVATAMLPDYLGLKAVVVTATMCPFIYGMHEGTLYLNWCYYKNMCAEEMLNHIVFSVLPATECDTLPLTKRLLKRPRSEQEEEPALKVPGYKWVRTEYSLVPE